MLADEILEKVVYSEYFHAFHVIFYPLEYIPNEPPHSINVIKTNIAKRARIDNNTMYVRISAAKLKHVDEQMSF